MNTYSMEAIFLKTITSTELAKLAGVSQSTVSRCLNNSPLVSAKTREHVLNIASQYSFQFNSNARGLRTNRTGIVGYVFSEDFEGFANHYIQSDLYFRIRNKLIANHLDLVPVFDDKSDGNISNIEKNINNRRFDALIINRPRINDKVRTLLEKSGIPHIFVYDTDMNMNYTCMISPDHKSIGYMVGDIFCKKGYGRFIEITGPPDRLDVINKHKGFSEAIKANGYQIEDKFILNGQYKFEHTRDLVKKNAELFLHGTCCFAHNDFMALGAIEGLKQAGIKVPEDVAIIGYDNIPMSTWAKPQLTTVAIDYEKIINLASQWVIELSQNKQVSERKVVIEGKLIYRDTF